MKMLFVAAEGDPSERKGPQVPNHHEEPREEIRHSGAKDDKNMRLRGYVTQVLKNMR